MLTPKINSLKALPDHKLELSYETGEVRIYDIKPHIWGSWYSVLADEKYFRSVRVLPDGYHIEWPEGQDLDPQVLYENSTLVSESAYA
jgi:hypothetical protein